MAVRGIHTGDAHIDSDVHGSINPTTGLNRAWESNAAALTSAVSKAIEDDVDFFIHAGDAFKNGRPSQEAVLLFAETMAPLADAGIPIVLIDGNHERLLVPTAQRTATATVGRLLAQRGEVHVVERDPRLVRLDSGIQVACLPWLSKTTILTRLGEDRLDPVEGDRKVVQCALDALDAMCEEADDTAPFLLASHVTVDDVRIDSVAKGCKRGSEVDIAHLFAEPIIPRKAIEAAPVSYAALSHIHARQRIGQKCFYAGAPNRLTLTDADDEKSANLITIGDDNTLISVDQFDTDARKMHAIDLLAADAETRLAALTEGALIGITLPPGEAAIPDEVREMIADAGATIISTKTIPTEATRVTTTTLPEKINPVDALKTWLADKKPDVDTDYAIAMAARLVEEEDAA